MKFHQEIKQTIFFLREVMKYMLTGFVFLPLLGPGRNPFLAEDEGCAGAICCGCITGGGAARGGTDWDIFCLLRLEVVGLGAGS
jgi:hypothetical protein